MEGFEQLARVRTTSEGHVDQFHTPMGTPLVSGAAQDWDRQVLGPQRDLITESIEQSGEAAEQAHTAIGELHELIDPGNELSPLIQGLLSVDALQQRQIDDHRKILQQLRGQQQLTERAIQHQHYGALADLISGAADTDRWRFSVGSSRNGRNVTATARGTWTGTALLMTNLLRIPTLGASIPEPWYYQFSVPQPDGSRSFTAPTTSSSLPTREIVISYEINAGNQETFSRTQPGFTPDSGQWTPLNFSFTAPITGSYLFDLSVRWASATFWSSHAVAVRRGATTIVQEGPITGIGPLFGSGARDQMVSSLDTHLGAGQELEFFVRAQDSAVSSRRVSSARVEITWIA